MRIIGCMRVRNEEDILEASVRHNLAVVDSLLVLDHGSDDATPAILAALVAEGLPLEVRRDDSLGLPGPDATQSCATRLLEGAADACIPLDADEFLRVPSRTALEQLVHGSDPAQPLALSVRTYVPAFEVQGSIVQRLRHARTAPGAPEGAAKFIVRSMVAPGLPATPRPARFCNPSDDGAAPSEPARVPIAVAMVARVPVRSAEQFNTKVAMGHLLRALGDDGGGPFRWQDEYAALMAGRVLTPERLTAIAARYDLPAGSGLDPQAATWVEDPFLRDIELVHTPARAPNPLGRILAFGERVASAIAQRTGGL